MKLSFISTAIFMIILGFAANAQEKGDFIITKPGDTLYGEVFLPMNALREVQFKKSGDKNFNTYKPSDLVGYVYQNSFVKSCAISQKGSNVPDNMFLLSIVQGAVNLYHLQESKSFYLEKNGAFHLLEKNDRLIDGKLLDDRKFMGILKVLFSDCSTPEKKYEDLQFTIQSISDITKTYNKCRDPKISYKNKVSGSLFSFQFGVLAGLAANQTTTNGKRIFFLKNDKYKTAYTIGVELSVNSSFLSNFRLRPGVALTQKNGGFQERFSQDDVFTKVSLTYLQFPVRLEYIFQGKKISPMISGGFLTSLAIDNEKTVIRQFRTSGEVYSTEKTKLYKPTETGFVGSAGLQLNLSKKSHPFIEYQFEKTKVAFGDGYVLTTHKLMLGVRF